MCGEERQANEGERQRTKTNGTYPRHLAIPDTAICRPHRRGIAICRPLPEGCAGDASNARLVRDVSCLSVTDTSTDVLGMCGDDQMLGDNELTCSVGTTVWGCCVEMLVVWGQLDGCVAEGFSLNITVAKRE